jgi:hypothetical protein
LFRRPFRRTGLPSLAVQCSCVLLRVGHQLLQIAAWNAPLSPRYIPNVEALDSAVRKLLVEGPLEVEELIVLFLFFKGSEDDQIVPYVAAGPLSAKLLRNSTFKSYKNFPHGMPTTEADTINADLLAFLKKSKQVAA